MLFCGVIHTSTGVDLRGVGGDDVPVLTGPLRSYMEQLAGLDAGPSIIQKHTRKRRTEGFLQVDQNDAPVLTRPRVGTRPNVPAAPLKPDAQPDDPNDPCAKFNDGGAGFLELSQWTYDVDDATHPELKAAAASFLEMASTSHPALRREAVTSFLKLASTSHPALVEATASFLEMATATTAAPATAMDLFPQLRGAGTRPVAPGDGLASDGKPIDNALVEFFKLFKATCGITSIPQLIVMVAPLLFSRGFMMPEIPEWFQPEEVRPGAWRDPYPFVLPSSTPGNMVPGI